MPEGKVIVYLKDTGAPMAMFSVDAAEALRLGDYVSMPPGGKDLKPEDLAAMRSQAMAAQAPKPPELMTPEERAAVRADANRAEVARLEAAQQPIPVALQSAVGVAHAPVRATKADMKDEDPPKVAERHPASGRKDT